MQTTTRFDSGDDRPSLTKTSRDQKIPISAGQAGLRYTLESKEPHYTYNEQVEFHIDGALDPGLIQRCMNALVERHEALRTTFAYDGKGKSVQTINDPYTVELTIIPVGDDSMDETALRQEIRRVSLQQGQRKYDLTTGPLFRTCLLQLPANKQIFLLLCSHIILDGASIVVLFKEWQVLEAALSKGVEPPLRFLPFQFADYAAWEHRYLTGKASQPARHYWQEALLNTPDPLALPYDRPWSANLPMDGSWEPVVVSAQLMKKLSRLKKKLGVTENVLLLGALQVLLMRYTGQTDICVGSQRANRPFPELKGTAGYYVNNITVRSNLSGDISFERLLSDLKPVIKAACYRHPLPYSTQIEIARANGRPAYHPLCQVVLEYGGIPFEPFSFSAGQKVTRIKYGDMGGAKFEISLSLIKSEDRLEGHFEFNKALFDPGTIRRFKQHYLHLLESVANHPGQCVSTIPLLTEAESRQLLEQWNDSNTSYPADQCIHEWIEQQVERTPDETAVKYDGQQLTYRELNRHSNQLANYLIEQGVKQETKVGLSIDRSLELVIAILGILKAGGAYVPIDKNNPRDRLNYIAEDSDIKILVTDHELLDKALEMEKIRCIYLDRDWATISAHNSENPRLFVHPQNLAYVIYTSGSTGRPKGTLTTHASVVRLFTATEHQYHFNQDDVWTLFHSYAFDFSVWEIWGALFYGGRVIVVPYWMSREPERFCRLAYEEGVTVLNQTPSAFKQFIAADRTLAMDREQLRLRYVIFGGEALDIKSLQPWFERHSDQQPRLINMYGITETTVHVTYYPIDKTAPPRPGSIIGKKLADLQAYILDAHSQVVPIGVPGELHIGGAGVARGYHNRPDLSAERFVPNPFGSGARLYKTGDLARYLPNGEIEYLGRIDQQIKIRGFRIELGEIESALTKLSGILEAVVLAHHRGQDDGPPYLAAYVVCNDVAAQNQRILRDTLKASLPAYMIPSFFVFLDKLPLTSNGKVDRKALPKPQTTALQIQKYEASHTETEGRLVAIWADVLRIDADQIGIHANFFELGGDSILSLQVIAQARELGLQFTPNQLFEYPTIAELSNVVKKNTAVKIDQGQVIGKLPLLPIQHWFFENIDKNLNHYNQAFVLKVPNILRQETLSKALEALARHHDALRLRFTKTANGWTQTLAPWQPEDVLSHIDLSSSPPDRQRLVLEQEASAIQTRLDIQQGPLLRAALFYRGEHRSCRLLVVIHHLAVDGVSWRILLADLFTAYRQIEKGEAVKLPEKTTSYKTWAEQLQIHSQSDTVLAELNHWRELTRHKPRLLPQDRSSGAEANTVAAAKTFTVYLDREDTRALLQQVPAAYNTQINDILLTALALVLQQWTHENIVLIDLEGHGREDIIENVDLSRTIGWFTSIYPVGLALSPSADLGESLKSIKEQLRRIPNRGIGYGLLRYCSHAPTITEAMKNLPAAQIRFNYLGQFDRTLDTASSIQWADECVGETQSPHHIRTHLIDILGLIKNNSLQLNIIYSGEHYDANTIAGLGTNLLRAVKDLIAHCSAPEAFGYTPSDFADADMTPEELDELMNSLGVDQ